MIPHRLYYPDSSTRARVLGLYLNLIELTEDGCDLAGCFGSCQDLGNSLLVLFTSELDLHEFGKIKGT